MIACELRDATSVLLGARSLMVLLHPVLPFAKAKRSSMIAEIAQKG
jgi:hypothetical protein